MDKYKYKLKKGIENFQVVDGPFTGRKFAKDREYSEKEVPPEEKTKFEKIKKEIEAKTEKQKPEKSLQP